MWIGTIPLNIRRNPLITDKSKLLYCEIVACLNDDAECKISNKKFSKWMGVSESSIKNYLKELKDAGYINIDGEARARTITLATHAIVKEVSEEKKDKNNKKRELTEKIVEHWNKEVVKGRGIRVTPKLIDKVTARSKVFSDEEIMEAVEKRARFVNNSEWHNKPENLKYKKDISILLRDDDAIDKLLITDVKDEPRNTSDINVFKIN